MGGINSGRRPEPTWLRMAKGHTRRVRDDEPEVPAGKVERPRLSAGARRVWDRLLPICTALGAVTMADAAAFATLCELQASLDTVHRVKSTKRFRPFIMNGAGSLKPHPALAEQKDLATRLLAYYDRFGLTPSGRTRLVVPHAAAPEVTKADKWAAMGLS